MIRFILVTAIVLLHVSHPHGQSAKKGYIGIFGAPVIPSGVLADTSNAGGGIGLNFMYMVTGNFGLTGSIEYHIFGHKGAKYIVHNFGKYVIKQKIHSNKYIPLTFGFVYNLPKIKAFTPYVTGKAGFYTATGRIRGEGFGLAPGVGVHIPVKNKLLDVSLQYTTVNRAVKHNYLSLNIGIKFENKTIKKVSDMIFSRREKPFESLSINTEDDYYSLLHQADEETFKREFEYPFTVLLTDTQKEFYFSSDSLEARKDYIRAF